MLLTRTPLLCTGGSRYRGGYARELQFTTSVVQRVLEDVQRMRSIANVAVDLYHRVVWDSDSELEWQELPTLPIDMYTFIVDNLPGL